MDNYNPDSQIGFSRADLPREEIPRVTLLDSMKVIIDKISEEKVEIDEVNLRKIGRRELQIENLEAQIKSAYNVFRLIPEVALFPNNNISLTAAEKWIKQQLEKEPDNTGIPKIDRTMDGSKVFTVGKGKQVFTAQMLADKSKIDRYESILLLVPRGYEIERINLRKNK